MPTPDDAKARLAYERGRKEADIAAHTREQDDHLKRINGSIDRTGTALGELSDHVETLEGKVDGIIAEQARRDTVNAALAQAGKRQVAKRLSRIQVTGLIFMALVAACSLSVAILQAINAAGHH